MKKWVFKAVIQKTISFLPYKHHLNLLFQTYVTKGVQLSNAYFEDKLIHFKQHNQFRKKYLSSQPGWSALEIGTGWYPVVPICCFLAGAKEITSVDLSRLTNKEKLKTTLSAFINGQQKGQLKDYFQIDPHRWAIIKDIYANYDNTSFEEVCQQLHFNYLVTDARKLPLKDNSIEFILSNNTFEHIYEDILKDILREFNRVLTTDGLMSHFIDMSDHFAHLDQSITIYNFLKYSPEEWDRIDNSIQPQNRLRISHFREIYKDLRIPITEEVNRPGDVELVKSLPIHSYLKDIPSEDIAISHCYLASSSKE
ncbi:MAG: cyclopropane fatty-acyl-phospholipid synthase-like methyltransferase [Patescibacteria group bacterium]|jgi:cyclopropane fatty-acyl-phospholipid synthase-like methyltransferase